MADHADRFSWRGLRSKETRERAPGTFGTAVVGMLGFAAVLLAAMGIYGVISFSVGQRTHEMGIRVALGAGSGNIIRLIVKQGFLLTAIVVAFASARIMHALLYGVGTLDPLTFIGMPALLVAVALAASYVPARRATRVDPITALRYE